MGLDIHVAVLPTVTLRPPTAALLLQQEFLSPHNHGSHRQSEPPPPTTNNDNVNDNTDKQRTNVKTKNQEPTHSVPCSMAPCTLAAGSEKANFISMRRPRTTNTTPSTHTHTPTHMQDHQRTNTPTSPKEQRPLFRHRLARSKLPSGRRARSRPHPRLARDRPRGPIHTCRGVSTALLLVPDGTKYHRGVAIFIHVEAFLLLCCCTGWYEVPPVASQRHTYTVWRRVSWRRSPWPSSAG